VPGLVCLVAVPLILYVIFPPEVKDTPDAPAKARRAARAGAPAPRPSLAGPLPAARFTARRALGARTSVAAAPWQLRRQRGAAALPRCTTRRPEPRRGRDGLAVRSRQRRRQQLVGLG
jgi:hypothetical protein